VTKRFAPLTFVTISATALESRSLGTPSGGKPEDGAGAVPAGGFALRSRADSESTFPGFPQNVWRLIFLVFSKR
jgi:hypothetical protein